MRRRGVFDGPETKPEDLECLPFLKAVRGEDDVYVRPEQAATVTRIPEGIYRSAASGKPYCFKKTVIGRHLSLKSAEKCDVSRISLLLLSELIRRFAENGFELIEECGIVIKPQHFRYILWRVTFANK